MELNSLLILLEAAEYLERRDREAEHGYASVLPFHTDYSLKKTKAASLSRKSQSNRTPERLAIGAMMSGARSVPPPQTREPICGRHLVPAAILKPTSRLHHGLGAGEPTKQSGAFTDPITPADLVEGADGGHVRWRAGAPSLPVLSGLEAAFLTLEGLLLEEDESPLMRGAMRRFTAALRSCRGAGNLSDVAPEGNRAATEDPGGANMEESADPRSGVLLPPGPVVAELLQETECDAAPGDLESLPFRQHYCPNMEIAMLVNLLIQVEAEGAADPISAASLLHLCDLGDPVLIMALLLPCPLYRACLPGGIGRPGRPRMALPATPRPPLLDTG
uniref:Uncharacterized protein n=1 Tax=Leptobrachium leishanense TaxID=445787 RepID=A0A8C5LYK9_9ANUR